MAFDAKTPAPKPENEHARPTSPHRESPHRESMSRSALRIAELTFDHQIVIWALRMRMQNEAGSMPVQRQFFRALPPASARIAFDAIETIVAILQRHGTRPIAFHTLNGAEVSRDEFLLLTVFCAVVEEPPSLVLTRAGWLVKPAGRDRFVSAVASLGTALSARHDRHAAPAAEDGFPVTVH